MTRDDYDNLQEPHVTLDCIKACSVICKTTLQLLGTEKQTYISEPRHGNSSNDRFTEILTEYLVNCRDSNCL